MILCLGPGGEELTLHMLQALREQRLPVLFVADEAWGQSAYMDARQLVLNGQAFPLCDIHAVFSRLGASQAELSIDTAGIINWLNRVEGVRVVNRPWTQVANMLKPMQYAAIIRAGLKVPPTCILQHARLPETGAGQTLIAKSLGGEQRPALADPLHGEGDQQVQLRIEGTNIRVHVIGDEVLALRVNSDVLDYRFAALTTGAPPSLQPCRLDDDLARRCVGLVRGMGLLTAGVDLIETPCGKTYCLEVNPNPGFTWFEAVSGQPVTESVLRLLSE